MSGYDFLKSPGKDSADTINYTAVTPVIRKKKGFNNKNIIVTDSDEDIDTLGLTSNNSNTKNINNKPVVSAFSGTGASDLASSNLHSFLTYGDSCRNGRALFDNTGMIDYNIQSIGNQLRRKENCNDSEFTAKKSLFPRRLSNLLLNQLPGLRHEEFYDIDPGIKLLPNDEVYSQLKAPIKFYLPQNLRHKLSELNKELRERTQLAIQRERLLQTSRGASSENTSATSNKRSQGIEEPSSIVVNIQSQNNEKPSQKMDLSDNQNNNDNNAKSENNLLNPKYVQIKNQIKESIYKEKPIFTLSEVREIIEFSRSKIANDIEAIYIDLLAKKLKQKEQECDDKIKSMQENYNIGEASTNSLALEGWPTKF